MKEPRTVPCHTEPKSIDNNAMAPGPKYESAEALEPGRGRKGSAVHTRHDQRRSETHGCKYMGEKCSKISENHIQKKDGHMAFPAVWATGTRQGEALEDGKDPPCIRDTFRDVQRHMGASTWVKDDRKSVKITSRKLMDTCPFRPFGRR